MEFVKKFKSFLLNKELENDIVYDNSVKIDPEILDTCDDILRDFNEENDTDLKIYLFPICIVKNLVDRKDVYKKGLDFLLDKHNIICVDVHSNPSERNEIRNFIIHIISYFRSMDYKMMYTNGCWYFYVG